MAIGAAESTTEPFDPDVTKWAPWRPQDVARRLAGVAAPWYVAGGWAIDLFLGHARRAHEDIEIGVPRGRFGEVAAALAGYDFFVVGQEGAWPLAVAGDAVAARHQTWVREPATGLWRLDVFREPSEDGAWVCRRDARIRLPYDRLIARTADGIPYGRPEVVLLFKAKALRPNDEGDFAAALPRLGPEARRWLSEALALVHPGHRWLAALRRII